MNEAEYLMKNHGDRGGCYAIPLGLCSSANILQIADYHPSCLLAVYAMFLAIISPSSSCSSRS